MTNKKRFSVEVYTLDSSCGDELCECSECKNYPENIHMTFASASSATAKRFAQDIFPEAKIYVREL